jgi:hypothetical protein
MKTVGWPMPSLDTVFGNMNVLTNQDNLEIWTYLCEFSSYFDKLAVSWRFHLFPVAE